MSPEQIRNLTADQRYSLIVKLINADIDDRVEEDFASSGYATEEEYRDDAIAHWCLFLKQDLQSDNA